MKTVIINGSPRRNGNTADLCRAFEDGLRSAAPDSDIERINLNDLNFRGCQSCFSCKRKGSNLYGACALKDELSPILNKIIEADCLVIGTPIYLMDVSAATKAFLERLCFSLGSYEKGYRSLAPKPIKVFTIYTMNTTEQYAPTHAMDNADTFLGHIFTPPHRICAYNTYQFHDYSKYVVEVFDIEEKTIYRKQHWPQYLDQVYTLARNTAKESLAK